jgi:hypothetical protein
MGSLTVYFAGICTHLREFTSGEVEHRVVLVEARGEREVSGETIVGHEASLHYFRVEDGAPMKRTLDGVQIKVLNAVGTDIVYESVYFRAIPRLTAYAPTMRSLSRAVVRGHDPKLAAAYFDASGTMAAGLDKNGASVAVLRVETNGQPVLRIENFSLHPDGPLVDDISLPDKSKIQIENVGPGVAKGDRHHDFLLHCLVAEPLPSSPTWPMAPAACEVKLDLPFTSNTVDPGCSNSNYP